MKDLCLKIESFRIANNIPIYQMCNDVCVSEDDYVLLQQGKYTLSVYQQIAFITTFECFFD